jgi:hypothetical protein
MEEIIFLSNNPFKVEYFFHHRNNSSLLTPALFLQGGRALFAADIQIGHFGLSSSPQQILWHRSLKIATK